MKSNSLSKIGKVVLVLICFQLSFFNTRLAIAQAPYEALQAGFVTPPLSAKPRTWWHWTRGNITKEGITKDLEWMKRVGIGGFQLADVNFGSGQDVETKVEFGSPEWLAMVRHAAEEAERLDLEMAMFSSAGWSLAGGPWVKPEQAMKKLVWSETSVTGPQQFSEKLPHPPVENGLIRNMWRGSQPQNDPGWYGDHAVIAYPTPHAELDLEGLDPKVFVNGKEVDGTALLDDDLNSSLTLPVDPDSGNIMLEYHYPVPVTIRSASFAARAGIPYGKLSISKDREHYTTLAMLPGPQLYRSGKVRTYAFPEQQGRYLRLEITGAPPSPARVMSQPAAEPLTDSLIFLEIKPQSGTRVHRWEDKAGYSFLFDYSTVESPNANPPDAIDPARIIDLSSNMDKDGNLHWEVPEGQWTILRTGYSLTGAKNRPAVPSGLGYEVDKLSKTHVLSYIKNYLDPIREELGLLFGERLQYLLLDSWEAGMQNWTEEMPEEFKQRRGYDLLPYLPALAGRVVESPEQSDRFLWDFRRTLADMFAENFYAVMTGYLNDMGLKTYGEASGVSLEILEDALLNKKYVDIPMGEFWVRDLHPSAMYHVDVRGAASAGHAYNKPIIGAEAFTGGNFETPQTLKRVSDYWFTQGVNRLVFHTSTHQPLDSRPGNAMVGAHLHRNITWAEQAAPFMTYIARNSFMLQQGKFVADIAYLLPEGAPSTMPFWGAGLQPLPPEGYDYDYINTDILLNRLEVDDNGSLILPDGMKYEVLVLPRSKSMTLEVMRKIHQLVHNGATIMGPRPVKTPGPGNIPNGMSEFERLKFEVWADLDGVSRTKHFSGNGKVIWGENLPDVLNELEVERDVMHSSGLNTHVSWIHRRVDDTDVYFLSNQADKAETLQFSFRVTGKQPELWHPDDGSIEEVSYTMEDDRTIMPITLDAEGSVFVVFGTQAILEKKTLTEYKEKLIYEINSPWTLRFPEASGAPPELELTSLESWTEYSDLAIKYFSGTAGYQNQFVIPDDLPAKDREIWLDLGKVRDLAEVYVNDQEVDILWKEPYRVNITSFVKPGENQLRVDVTNQWTNRLAGDQDLPEEERKLDSFIPRFGGAWEAQLSGLLSTVRILVRSSDERK